jgi:acetate kinase
VKNAVIVLNSGSTSLKFAVYLASAGEEGAELCRGVIDSMHEAPHFVVKDKTGKPLAAHEWGADCSIGHGEALQFVIAWIEKNMAEVKVAAAGHRVVLGGARYSGPALIEGDALDYLASLARMEPSHQPYNVAGARALTEVFPGLPQVACFDSSFHRTMPEVAQIYALPQEAREAGARHWGYHGLSYDYISRQIPKYAPKARRVIVGHLGGGASVCAMLDGKSMETSMGFAGLTGLPMATRSGDVPADALFYLLRRKQYDPASLEKALYKQSGLLGLSGVSGDMRALEASDDPRCRLAIDYFVYCVVKYVGAYAAVLGGLDALVFTAGVGENAPSIRAAVCERLGWLGAQLDPAANAKNGPRISREDSPVSVWVIPTDEELMIAQHTLAVVRQRGLMQR